MAKPLKRHQSATEARSHKVGLAPDDVGSNAGMRRGSRKGIAKTRVGHGRGRMQTKRAHRAKSPWSKGSRKR